MYMFERENFNIYSTEFYKLEYDDPNILFIADTGKYDGRRYSFSPSDGCQHILHGY